MIAVDFRTPSLYFPYLHEILAHLGAPYERAPRTGDAVWLIDGSVPAPAAIAAEVRLAASAGAMVVALGGVAGMPDLFGAQQAKPVGEAWLHLQAPGNAFLADQPDSLHGFGVLPLKPDEGTEVLAGLTSESGAALGAGLTVKAVGKGLAVALAVDLPQTVLRIQQGWPVFQDGKPAADGTVPVEDGILKVDDGCALHYDRDRGPGEGAPYFDRPIADQWRELLLRLLLWAHDRAGQPLAHLWYWPEGVEAVCHYSHDTDMCGEEPARTTLAELKKAGIQATFCVIYPEKWPRQLYDEIRADGHEVAFHYNAMQDTEQSHWGLPYLKEQVAYIKAESGQERLVSTKQHVFRWQGEVEIFRLLEAAGIECDGTKGGSKVGNYGMPFGSCHPWFPMEYGDYSRDGHRFINVLEIPLLTMDMAYRSPLSTALAMMDVIKRYHGVAHYGPHPIWIHTKPEVAVAFHALVERSRELGLQWWTSADINRWERLRRRVRLEAVAGGVTVHVPEDFPSDVAPAALVLHPVGETSKEGMSATVDGTKVSAKDVTVHGRPALMVPLRLEPGARYLIQFG